MRRRQIFTVCAVGALVVGLAACSGDSQYDASHDDTGYNLRDFGLKDIVIMPDGFPNFASVCDPFTDGIRVYITTRKGDLATMFAMPDPTCKKTGAVNKDGSNQTPNTPPANAKP